MYLITLWYDAEKGKYYTSFGEDSVKKVPTINKKQLRKAASRMMKGQYRDCSRAVYALSDYTVENARLKNDSFARFVMEKGALIMKEESNDCL